jgi:hypothetical protein
MHCLEGISEWYFHSPVLAQIQNFSEKNIRMFEETKEMNLA